IAVSAGPATHLAVAAPPATIPGPAFYPRVAALDAYGDVKPPPRTGEAGRTDSSAGVLGDGGMNNRTGELDGPLNTPGTQSIAASDTADPSIKGDSAPIAVGGGTAALSASPGFGSGMSYKMRFTFSDPRGWQDLDVVNVLINDFLDGRNACYLA